MFTLFRQLGSFAVRLIGPDRTTADNAMMARAIRKNGHAFLVDLHTSWCKPIPLATLGAELRIQFASIVASPLPDSFRELALRIETRST